MPRIECATCIRYKNKECDLEHGDYYKFKQCMLGQRNYFAANEDKTCEEGENASEDPRTASDMQ